jgi:predicted amidohydrolase YtcJ
MVLVSNNGKVVVGWRRHNKNKPKKQKTKKEKEVTFPDETVALIKRLKRWMTWPNQRECVEWSVSESLRLAFLTIF